MPQRLTKAQVPSRSRKPSCWSMTATTVSTAEPRKLATEYQRLEGRIQPNRLAAKAPRIASAPRTEITCSTSASTDGPLTSQGVILLVGDHATSQRHTVGEVVHTCYFYYIPDFFLGQPESLEAFEVFRIAIQRALCNLDGEVQDGRAAFVEAGPPVIQGDAVGKDGVAQGLAKGGAVGDQAVEAAVRHRDGHGDHLPLRGVQVRGWLVELSVMGEPGGEPLGTVAVSSEDVGDEPDHLPRLPEKPLQVIGKLGLLGDGEPAYGHTGPLARYVLDIGHRLLLAVYGPHLHFAVALASGRAARHGPLDAGEVVFGERYIGGASIVFEVLTALVPGMGTMSSPWTSSHARASCPGVIPLPSATSRTLSANSRFFWKFSSAKRGKRTLRVSFSGMSSMLLQRPVRKPRRADCRGRTRCPVRAWSAESR